MIADLVVLFPAPCSLLLILYSVRFTVARSEAEAVSGMTNGASCADSEPETKSRGEKKSLRVFSPFVHSFAHSSEAFIISTCFQIDSYELTSPWRLNEKPNIFIINAESGFPSCLVNANPIQDAMLDLFDVS